MQRLKQICLSVIAATLFFTGSYAVASESSASVTVDVASAYVFRGTTFNDEVVVQPGVELSGRAITLGVWANYDLGDYDDTLDDSQFSEIDIYASYDIPVPVEKLGVSLGYCEYTYPGVTGEAEREVSISFSVDTFLSPSLSVNYGTDGAVQENMYMELGLAHGFEVSDELSMELALALGYFDPDAEGADSGLSHCTVTLGASYKIMSFSLTYVNQIDDDVLPDVEDGGGYDVEVYGMIGVGFEY